MTSDAAPERAQPNQSGQADQPDPVEQFGSIFRQQLDHAIEPIVENIRRHHEAAAAGGTDVAPESRDVPHRSNRGESAGKESEVVHPAAFSFSSTVHLPEAKDALHTVLDGALEALFAEELQQAFRERSEQTVQSLIGAAQKLASHGTEFDAKPEQFAKSLDGLVQESFSSSMRKRVRQDGEKVIRAMIKGDGPAAREAGTRLLSHLDERRLAAAGTFWQEVLEALMKAGHTAKQPTNGKARNAADTSDAASEDHLPQTLLRSDKRAQEIWTKARDKAAEKDGPGVRAERAAYAVLKERYEKKGDHWVKKTGDDSNAVKASGTNDRKEPAQPAKPRSKS